MEANRMHLNVQKTKVCVFGTKNVLRKLGPVNLQFKNTILKTEETIKCLGLTLDSKLNWKPHINNLTKTLNYTLNTIKTLSSILSDKSIRTLTCALSLSNVNYMACIWRQAAQCELKSVEKCLRRGARVILQKTKRDQVLDEMTTELNWLLHHYLFYYKFCLFLHDLLYYPFKIPYFQFYLTSHNNMTNYHKMTPVTDLNHFMKRKAQIVMEIEEFAHWQIDYGNLYHQKLKIWTIQPTLNLN